jgi:hypothetical protein
MDQEQAIDALLKAMSDEEKAHFKTTVLKFLTCYGPNANQAVLIIKNTGEDRLEVATMNLDEMEAAEIMIEANDFFGFLNTIDAPPKEAFN